MISCVLVGDHFCVYISISSHYSFTLLPLVSITRVTMTSSGKECPALALKRESTENCRLFFSCTVHDEPQLTSQKGAAAGGQNKQLRHSQQVLWEQLLLSRPNLKMALNSVNVIHIKRDCNQIQNRFIH